MCVCMCVCMYLFVYYLYCYLLSLVLLFFSLCFSLSLSIYDIVLLYYDWNLDNDGIKRILKYFRVEFIWFNFHYFIEQKIFTCILLQEEDEKKKLRVNQGKNPKIY